MRIALSGTPGTGKTSVTKILQNNGYHVIPLNDIALQKDFIVGVDKKRDTTIIDIAAVDRYISKQIPGKDLVFIEGHAAHLLTSVRYVIILRCHPRILKKRLQQKGWKPSKIQENIEAETIDIILCEAVDIHPEKNIFEIDTTSKTIKEVAHSIQHLITIHFRPAKTYSIGQIDWSEELLTMHPS